MEIIAEIIKSRIIKINAKLKKLSKYDSKYYFYDLPNQIKNKCLKHEKSSLKKILKHSNQPNRN
jgi:hypothetical protein